MWVYDYQDLHFRIFPKGSRFVLEISGVNYGSYASPQKAADDVACFATQCPEWDELDGQVTDYPSDLSEWTDLYKR
jgi:hypothetical protein